MLKIVEYLKRSIPFEIKRSTSVISVVLTIIIIGFLTEIGKWIFGEVTSLFKLSVPFISNFYLWSTSITYQISLLAIFFYLFLLVVLIFPIYRKLDKFFMFGKNKELIFKDNFVNNKGWHLNYWGTNNPEKTNRVENSTMVFEAQENEVQNKNKEFGAFYDLKNGIYEGFKYEVCCKVKSDPSTTMKFQLWLHDNVVGNKSSTRTKKEPKEIKTPGNEFEEIKARFIATSTNGIRIHLHNKAGFGKIYIKEVSVYKVS